MTDFALSKVDVLILVLAPTLVVVVGLIASCYQEKTAKGYFFTGVSGNANQFFSYEL